MAGPGLDRQPELAWLPVCAPKPVSVGREPRSRPPASAAAAPSRATPGCVLLGEMAALFRALGVFVHTRGGGVPWWEAGGVSQGQASAGSAPSWGLPLGPPAAGRARLPAWQLARHGSACPRHRTASKGGAQRQPANRWGSGWPQDAGTGRSASASPLGQGGAGTPPLSIWGPGWFSATFPRACNPALADYFVPNLWVTLWDKAGPGAGCWGWNEGEQLSGGGWGRVRGI